jgi:hypothetical protein
MSMGTAFLEKNHCHIFLDIRIRRQFVLGTPHRSSASLMFTAK